MQAVHEYSRLQKCRGELYSDERGHELLWYW